MKIAIDYDALQDIELDGIDTRDYSDFCDAYISYASYPNRELTEDELETLNENSNFVYDCVMERLF